MLEDKNLEKLSYGVKENLTFVFGKFKDESLKINSLEFENPEVHQTI